MTQTIEQLTARVRELEEFKANVVKECASIIKHAHKDIAKQLAASQAYAEQLREALEFLSARIVTMDLGGVVERALALPRDTSALDAYVAEKVKEASTQLLEKLEQLTRQRDLAVEALEKSKESLGTVIDVRNAEDWPKLHHTQMLVLQAISTIKESEAK